MVLGKCVAQVPLVCDLSNFEFLYVLVAFNPSLLGVENSFLYHEVCEKVLYSSTKNCI